MAKKQTKKKKEKAIELDEDIDRAPTLQEETVRVIYAIVFVIASLVLIFSFAHKAGPVGTSINDISTLLLGVGRFLLPILFLVLAVLFIKSIKQSSVAWPKLAGAALFLVAALGIISTLYKIDAVGQGGFVGNMIATPLFKLFDFWVTLIVLFGLLVISTILIFESHFSLKSLAFWRKDEDELLDGEELDEQLPTEKKPILAQEAEKEIDVPEVREPVKPLKKEKKEPGFSIASLKVGKPYVPPPIELLKKDSGKPGVGDIKANANIIKRTLQNFGINVEMDEISIGPSVTRYALKPAEGVKLARIVALHNDLSLALAAHPLRIEAPIPGKSLVGIEIPNTTKTTVGLGTLLSEPEFQESEKPLMVSLGKGISGNSHFANLAKMPHALVAGTTGSGKSVTIHAIITSLLYRNAPENLKFIMIDPKRVELTLYNNIPHLLTPVITDAKKSILALKWATKEMDRRYDLLEKNRVRDIDSYHKNILAPALKKLDGKEPAEGEQLPERMPYIVIIIDEMADLMQSYPRELEAAIVRLAQMSRAVGIHLMIATQRPSVNVITGLIKANIPTRLALQVMSQVDSRTILDTQGAEKLLGAGDMLFLSGESAKPQRIQSAYISEAEVKSVVNYLIDNYADQLPEEINLEGAKSEDDNSIFNASFGDDDGAEEDDLYEEAKDVVIKAGKASTSYLQRKLSVGYARAARIMDMLEERGVIGPAEGSKPREVIGGGGSPVIREESEPENV